MNVTLPEKTQFSFKDKLIYVLGGILCLIAIGAVIYIEINQDTSLVEIINKTSGIEISAYGNKTVEQSEELKSAFDEIFDNEIEEDITDGSIEKEDESLAAVYTQVDKTEYSDGNYDVSASIPYINIKNEKISEYNKEIEDTFKKKLDQVLASTGKNTVYTVEYQANAKDGILSILIRATIKEMNSAQRILVQTYNYDLNNNKEITLEEFIDNQKLDKEKIQKQINSEIEAAQKKVEDLKELNYNIFSRDINSDEYKIENTKSFYISDTVLYIMYPYGNNNQTSEMDIVIL